MNENELMIENYLKYPNTEPFKLEQDDFTSKNFWCDFHEGIIGPIPLTEKWLLKCGVYMATCLGETWQRRFIKFPVNDSYRTEIPEYIEFVHELQNWYYWHFNKTELTIK